MNISVVARSGIAIVALMIGTLSWAADAPPNSPPSHAQPSKETREKMAQAHEKMAACLRSERKVSECHAEMMKACHDISEHECGMMDHKGHHHMKPDGDAKPGEPAAK